MDTQIIFYGKLKLKADYHTLCRTHVVEIRDDKIIISTAYHYHLRMTEHFTYSNGLSTNARDNILYYIIMTSVQNACFANSGIFNTHYQNRVTLHSFIFHYNPVFGCWQQLCVDIFTADIFIRRSGDNKTAGHGISILYILILYNYVTNDFDTDSPPICCPSLFFIFVMNTHGHFCFDDCENVCTHWEHGETYSAYRCFRTSP